MALQELDLRIHYQPGKSNSNADVLSQFPVETNLVQTAIPTSRVFLAAMQPDQASAKDGDTPSHMRQPPDPQRPQVWKNHNVLILS